MLGQGISDVASPVQEALSPSGVPAASVERAAHLAPEPTVEAPGSRLGAVRGDGAARGRRRRQGFGQCVLLA